MLPEFLICGVEHSGTTLVSDLFRQVEGLDAGFECGVLLCESPRDFPSLQPFFGHMEKGWGIERADLLCACHHARDFGDFYAALRKGAGVLKPDTRRIFDKTPRYLHELGAVMARMERPVIVCFKDPRATVYSDFRRSGAAQFVPWYRAYRPAKLRYMEGCYRAWLAARAAPFVQSVGLEALAMEARRTLERLFAHAGYEFRLDYAVIEHLRYAHTRARAVNPEIVFAYRKALSRADLRQIAKDFAGFEGWFYE